MPESVLNPDTGIWEVGYRLGKHNPMFITPGSEGQKILDPSHLVTKLLKKRAHDESEHRGSEELHQGDGDRVPQQDGVRVQERHQEALHHPVDHQ